MDFYFRNSRLGAIHIECALNLGVSPLYGFSKWKNEVIIELPWMRIILTPALTLKNEKDFDKNGESNRPKTSHPHDTPAGYTAPYPKN